MIKTIKYSIALIMQVNENNKLNYINLKFAVNKTRLFCIQQGSISKCRT